MADTTAPTQDALIDPDATAKVAGIYGQTGAQGPLLAPPQFLADAIGRMSAYGQSPDAQARNAPQHSSLSSIPSSFQTQPSAPPDVGAALRGATTENPMFANPNAAQGGLRGDIVNTVGQIPVLGGLANFGANQIDPSRGARVTRAGIESLRSGQPPDAATQNEAIAMISGGLSIEGQAGKAALSARLAKGAQGADQSGIAAKLAEASGSALTKDAGRAASDAADAAAGRVPSTDVSTGAGVFGDAEAARVTSAVAAVPESIKSDLRKMLRGEVQASAPVSAQALASQPEFAAMLDDTLKRSGAAVSDANRLSAAQQLLEQQAVRNKIIVAKGYRNVPELPPDDPLVAEAQTLPDGGAAVFDHARQVLDDAAGAPPEGPTGPRLVATGGPNEPRIPFGNEPRQFGPRDLGQLASEVMYNGIVMPTVNLLHSFGSTTSMLLSFPERVLLSGADRALSLAGVTKGRNFTIEASIAGLNAQTHALGNAIAHDLVPNIVHGNETLADRDIPHEVSSAILGGQYGTGRLQTVLGALAKVASEGNYPLRTIAAVDDTIRRGLSAGALMERGYIKATNLGLKGAEAQAYAAKFVNEAPYAEVMAAAEAARTQINRQAPGGVASNILAMKEAAGPVGTVLLPFFNTKLNILKAATTWTPLGFGRLLPHNTPVLGYFTQKTLTEAQRVQALTRATTGTLLMYPLWQQVLSDNITGDGPADSRAKAQWVGDPASPSHVERALRTPWGWVTYGKVPVIGDYLAAIADSAQAVRDNKASDVSGAQAAMGGLLQYFAHEEQGVMDVASAVSALADWAKNPANAQAQQALAQQLADRGFELTPWSGALRAEQTIAGAPYKNPPLGTSGLVNRTLEEYRAQIPGANADMRQGAPRVPGVSAGVGALLPVKAAPAGPPISGTATGVPPLASAESDRLAAAIKGFTPIGLPTNKIGVGRPYEMTLSGAQYLDFSQAVGQARQEAIAKLLVTPAYRSATDSVKARLFVLAVSAADRSGEQRYLRDGVLTSSDPAQTQQDALLLMSQGTMADRAKWAGLMAQSGRLTGAMRAAIDAARPEPLPGQAALPTMAEYIHAAPLVSEYLAIPPYLQGNEQEWDALKVAKERLAAAESRFQSTGQYLPPTALHYQALSTLSPAEQQLIARYPVQLVNPLRRVFLVAHPEVGRYVG